jgi:hypothetical protein
MTMLSIALSLGQLLMTVAAAQELVVVDYGRPLLEAIREGRYEAVSRDFLDESLFPEHQNKRFVPRKAWGTRQQVAIELIPIGELWSGPTLPTTHDILLQLALRMYRPANLYELLALGEQTTAAFADDLVAALGSNGDRIASFDGDGALQALDTTGTQLIWNDRDWHFAAVRVVK